MSDNGGHAFPTDAYYDEKRYGVYEGMSMRDFFAAAALQAIVASTGQSPSNTPMPWAAEGITHAQWASRASFIYADAMLLERAK